MVSRGETQPSIQTASSRDARIAGALYCGLPLGCVRAVYVQGTLLAGSFLAENAAATAAAHRPERNDVSPRDTGRHRVGVLMVFVVLRCIGCCHK